MVFLTMDGAIHKPRGLSMTPYQALEIIYISEEIINRNEKNNNNEF